MNPTNRACRTATALLLISMSGLGIAGGGTYYRWVDPSGTPVNSDKPPPAGTAYEVVSTATNRSYPDAPQAESTTPQGTAGEGNAAVSPGNPTDSRFKKDPEYCAAAKQNLEALNTHARIRVPDGDGSYRFIDEDEKAAQRATAEAIIAQHCE